MHFRLLFAAPNEESLDLMRFLFDAAIQLTQLDIEVSQALTEQDVVARAEKRLDDVIMLDWPLAGADSWCRSALFCLV